MLTSTLLPAPGPPEGPGFDPLADPARLSALSRTGLMDSPPEGAFDRLTRLAGRVLRAPVALVSLVDDRRQFFKSALGLPEPWASRRQTPLTHSFCRHVVRSNGPLVVPDARLDPLVRENLAIRDLGVIAYLGAPLTTSEGFTLGAFCAIDGRPRAWDDLDLEVVTEMAASTMAEVELRMEVSQRREAESRLADSLRRAEALNLALRARTSELADCNARLELLARSDGLTGLLNIRAMRQELEDRAAFCLSAGLPMSVLMIDVDHFKAFNDAFGHPLGDDVLTTVAGLIRQGIRQEDLAGRYGGEEFIVGLPGCSSTRAEALAERLRASIASHPWPLCPVSASVGVSSASRPSDLPALIRAADEALYRAKRDGRNRVCVAEPLP
ncbi:sensor domain-containing diguanylate cyclase [Tautonia plasticadhaerens]|uniref:diguanylate cyclase n=1 Tax=Tautonia plasticadhaerens TaxID=2527974 RepID=A0A518H1Z4_9BACT|nr:sensor domain-containing diguanylate cyclase [Tautonia plasticadhaerens]QDV34866.1 putative diguanylate cyclase YedQ [Tautonia plasticadhaerens]